ncbi:UNVERIFIED_CONTAM: acyltransferase [Pseudomonas sp. JL1]
MHNNSIVLFVNKVLNTEGLLEEHKPIAPDISCQLDTLRGLSAIIVLIAHAQQIFLAPAYHGLTGLFGLVAQASVMVFFVLSGFLICKSITRNHRDNVTFNIKPYAIDRANRILPPLFFSTLLLVSLSSIAPSLFQSGTHDFLKASEFMARPGFYSDALSIFGSLIFLNGFFTQNISSNAPLWSLSFEVWYYVVIGVALRVRGGLILGVLFMVAMSNLNVNFLYYGIVWFAGAGIAVLHNKNLINPLTFKVTLSLFGALATVIAFLYLKSFIGITSFKQVALNLIPAWNVLIGLTFTSILALILAGTLSMPILAPRSADFSYTLYIVHFPILLFIYGLSQTIIMNSITISIIAALISSAACLLLAYFSAGVLESYRPLKSVGKRPAHIGNS